MRTSQLGQLEVSIVGLGCNNFGRSVDVETAAAMVDCALDAGITLFDTSDNYGEGRSESYLGKALRGRREEAVIATKFGNHLPWVEGSGGASQAWIGRAVENSLRQLETEYIDLYYLHKPDPTTPIESTLEELFALVDAGKVREIACSKLDAGQLDAAAAAAAFAGRSGFCATQMEYSLLHRDPEIDGVLDACRRHGMSLVPFYPLASGLLTGKHEPGKETGRLALARYDGFKTDENYALVNRLREFAQEHGHSLGSMAIAWLFERPEVPTVIAGASNPDHVTANAAAAQLALSQEELAAIEQMTRPATA